jgi:hypothetical protein
VQLAVPGSTIRPLQSANLLSARPAPPPALRKGSAFPAAPDARLFQGRLRLPVFHGYDFQGQPVSLHHQRGARPPAGVPN